MGQWAVHAIVSCLRIHITLSHVPYMKESRDNMKESRDNMKESWDNMKESWDNMKESRDNIKEYHTLYSRAHTNYVLLLHDVKIINPKYSRSQIMFSCSHRNIIPPD